MLAFIHGYLPFLPFVLGVGVGAAAVALCHSCDSREDTVRELKSRLEALERERKAP
jgi:hypothetical protein